MKQQAKNNNLLSFKELSFFCEQLAMVVDSGVMISIGVAMMGEDSNNPTIKKLLLDISINVEDNQTLAQALASTGAFPQYLIRMVEIGEESGELDAVLTSLADFYDQQYNMVETVKSAVLYPSLLVVMMLAVFLFLTAKILPVFQSVFNSLGAELPAPVLVLFNVGSAVNRFIPIVLIVAVIVIIAFCLLFKTKKGFEIMVNWIGRQKFSQEFSVYCFASSMSLMLASGLDARQAMGMASGVVINQNVQAKCGQALALIEDDNLTFVEALERATVIPPTISSMLAVGVKTGNIDKCLVYIANIYNDNFQQQLAKKVNLIEPISVGVLSFLIGIVLVAVMLPLLGIMSAIG